MNEHQVASSGAAVPDHAVVDNKGEKNDKNVAEQKTPAEADYTQVDKSKKKKKKKEEPDATYAQVDMSKKSKKVCQQLIIFFTFYSLQVSCIVTQCDASGFRDFELTMSRL